MRRVIALLLVLAMVLLPGCRKEDKWQKQFDLGCKYLSDGDYEEAILAFNLAVEIDPEKPETYLYRGDAYKMIALEYAEDGDYDKAEDYLDKAYDDYDRAEDRDYDDEDELEERREELEELEEELREQENTDQEGSANVPQEEAQPEPVVITVSDAYVDAIEDSEYGDTYCYHIPRFDMDGDAAAEVNEKIYGEMMTILEEQVYAWDYPGLGIMTYSWGQTDRIASVTIFTNPTYYHYPVYYVYAINLRNGQELTKNDVLAACGYDEESFRARAKEVLTLYYEDWRVELQNEMVDLDFFDEQMETTLSDENLALAVPYVDENGMLCMIVPTYGIAGAGCYNSRFCLEGTSYVIKAQYMECPTHNAY